MLRTVFRCSLMLLAGVAYSSSPSPYFGQEERDIKALSPQEIADLASGKGMGLAKAAELNRYPGPAHVLELAAQIELSPEQKTMTEMLFRNMQSRAIVLGKNLIEEERALDRLFASRSVTSAALEKSLTRIGMLQGRLRQVHLDAHIEQAALLSPEQIEKYQRLRGYAANSGHGGAGHRHH